MFPQWNVGSAAEPVCHVIPGKCARGSIAHMSTMGYLPWGGDYRVGDGHLQQCHSERWLDCSSPLLCRG